MKISTIIFSVILVSSLVILSGAAQCPQSNQTATNTAGLETSFVKDAPPVSVVVGNEFPIYADILNKGGEFINAGTAKFYLGGLGPNFEGVKLTLTNDKTLAKESVFADQLTFAEKAKYTFPLQEMTVVPIILTSCYSYGGRAQATLCITGSNESKVCQLSGEKLTASTAGPMQIANINEQLLKDKLVLTFDITNEGTGEVFLPDTDCDKLETHDFTETSKQGKVNVKITSRDNFNCKLISAGSQISGMEGISPVGKVICENDISNQDYSSPMTIEIQYKYRDSISYNLNVIPA